MLIETSPRRLFSGGGSGGLYADRGTEAALVLVAGAAVSIFFAYRASVTMVRQNARGALVRSEWRSRSPLTRVEADHH